MDFIAESHLNIIHHQRNCGLQERLFLSTAGNQVTWIVPLLFPIAYWWIRAWLSAAVYQKKKKKKKNRLLCLAVCSMVLAFDLMLSGRCCLFLSNICSLKVHHIPDPSSLPASGVSTIAASSEFPSTWHSSLLALWSQIWLHWSKNCPDTRQYDVYMCTEPRIICLLIHNLHFDWFAALLQESDSLLVSLDMTLVDICCYFFIGLGNS